MTASPIPRRIGWRGVAVELHAHDEVWGALAPHLPSFYDADGDIVATGHAVLDQDRLTVELPEELSISGSLDDATLRAVSSRLELLVCTHLPDRIAVHAGVAVHREQAIVLPGSSMAGKSTLTAALVDLGATYFSDEFALIDEQGLVWPYPRPMTLRSTAGRARTLPANAAEVGGPPVPLGLLADLRYAPESWRADEMSAAHGVLALLRNSPAAQLEPERAMNCLGAAMAHEPLSVTGTRGDATETAQRLIDAVDERLRG